MIEVLKRKINKILDVSNIGKNKYSTLVNFFIIFLIVFSAIETIFKSTILIILGESCILNLDRVIYVLFTLEFLLRIFAASEENKIYKGFFGRLKYLFSFYTFIDLLAIIPFYIEILNPGFGFFFINCFMSFSFGTFGALFKFI